MAMNIKAWRAEIDRLIAEIEAEFDKPTPAPHPLAGLEYQHLDAKEDPSFAEYWYSPEPCTIEFLLEGYAIRAWRDSTTHAPVPLWQVAKRLGVEHPVPPKVRWTDVEWSHASEDFWQAAGWGGTQYSWKIEMAGKYENHYKFRLTAQYDHQEITCAQFREILGREDKPASEVECKTKPAPDFRVGDLVEVVDAPDKSFWGCWFHTGERFVVSKVHGDTVRSHHDLWIGSNAIRLISRP
jgi:hypothetical protein